MSSLIPFSELPKWVPGQVLATSEGLDWQSVGMRSFRYQPSDVAVPALSHFMIVSYKRGTTLMERRFEGRWTRTECHAGEISLLTRSQNSHWHWTHEIDVTHVYLSDTLMSAVAADILDRTVSDVRLHDLLRVHDPVVSAIVDAIAFEAGRNAIGSALYAEALSTQLVVHLLRSYASFSYREQRSSGGLSPALCRRLVEYIDTHLHEVITLGTLAGLAGMGVWTLGRRFRTSFGMGPPAYIIGQRVARAQRLLSQATMPIKAIAAACGFADQAHLTRTIRSRLGTTPGALRRDHSS
jgi:AraC family transcriptional regulator